MRGLRTMLFVSCCACGVSPGTAAARSLFLPQQPVPAAATSPGKTLALLVGIQAYPDGSGLGALRGPENDVKRARKVLEERFSFDPAGIRELVGKDATHEAIVRAIKTHLIDGADAETRVVLWFSGHGSRVPDASKADGSPRDDGVDPFDETFVTYDSRARDPNGSYDLTDDELFSLLSAVRSRDIVLVTDCCHSGGLLRGGPAAGAREASLGTAPLDRRKIESFWPRDKVTWLDDDKLKDVPASIVHIAACGADQEAGELDTALGTFGTLTWHLSRALFAADRNDSWGRVAARVRANVAGSGNRGGQMVAIGGDADRALFGGRGRTVPSGLYQVDVIPRTKRFVVAAGTLHGIGDGAELTLYDLDRKEVGTARAYKVETTSCNAEWCSAGEPPSGALLAYPKTIGDPKTRLRVHLGTDVDPALFEGCEVACAVGEGDAPDYSLRRAGDTLELWDLAANLRARVMRPERAEVQFRLLKEYQFRSLWNGVALPGRFPVRVAVVPATPADLTGRKGELALVRKERTSGPFASAIVGAKPFTSAAGSTGGGYVKIVVENGSRGDLYIAIVSTCEDREVNVLLGKTRENVVKAGQKREQLVKVGPGPGWPTDKPMVDRYVVVATARYADFTAFESEATGSVTRGDGLAGLPPFLQSVLGGTRTRGDTDKPDWGITICDLRLVTPEVFRKTAGK